MKHRVSILFTLLMIHLGNLRGGDIQTDIDTSMTVTFSGNPKILDTLGQTTYRSETSNGTEFLMILDATRQPESNIHIKNIVGLDKYYDGFLQGLLARGDGKLEDQGAFFNGILKGRYARIRVDKEDETEIRESKILFLQNKTYLLQYRYSGEISDSLKQERDSFLSSIQLGANLPVSAQINQETAAYVDDYAKGKIVGNIVILAGLAMMVFYAFRKIKE